MTEEQFAKARDIITQIRNITILFELAGRVHYIDTDLGSDFVSLNEEIREKVIILYEKRLHDLRDQLAAI